MLQYCPNCSKRSFSALQVLAAAMPTGVACPECGVIVRIPFWRRVYAGSPILMFAVWNIVYKPPMELLNWWAIACAVLVFVLCFTSPFEKA